MYDYDHKNELMIKISYRFICKKLKLSGSYACADEMALSLIHVAECCP